MRSSAATKSVIRSTLSVALGAVWKMKRSRPAPPFSASLPAPPYRRSLPAAAAPACPLPLPPLSVLAAALPVRTLASVLPVPLLVRAAGERQALQVVTQRPAHRGLHGVDLARQRRGLADAVAGAVDHVGVSLPVPPTRLSLPHRRRAVDTRAAVERVVARAAAQHVGRGVAVSRFASVLPVPLTALLPVSVRRSRLAPRVQVTEDCT
jgi:hypothetical protein